MTELNTHEVEIVSGGCFPAPTPLPTPKEAVKVVIKILKEIAELLD